jgi:hypothetical protein
MVDYSKEKNEVNSRSYSFDTPIYFSSLLLETSLSNLLSLSHFP